MDGNGRWAKERGLPRSEGHKAGTETAKKIVTECRKSGVEYLTLYAFSKENWRRPKEEVNFLFDLLIRFLRQEQRTLLENSIRLNILGAWEELPFAVRRVIKHTLDKSASCDQMVLNFALNYSGRDEILRAVRGLLQEGISSDAVDEQLFRSYLYSAQQPDPDLIIRTSGEHRLSNYLVFQSAYSELYFTPTYWPDFDEQALHEAFEDFRNRERRFGGIGNK
jgi:undecaprenyl diphosphate synthase